MAKNNNDKLIDIIRELIEAIKKIPFQETPMLEKDYSSTNKEYVTKKDLIDTAKTIKDYIDKKTRS